MRASESSREILAAVAVGLFGADVGAALAFDLVHHLIPGLLP